MSIRSFFVSAGLALALLVAASGASAAQGGHADLTPPSLDGAAGAIDRDYRVAQRGCMSLNQAVSRARSQHPNGRIVSAETKRRGNRVTHEVKVLTGDGKVKTLRFPGCN